MINPHPASAARAVFGVKRFGDIPRLLPGALLAAAVMLAALPVADLLGDLLLRLRGVDPAGKASPVSGVTVAILLGLVVGNAVKLAPAFRAGIEFSVKKLLRLGIILVGIKLSVLDVLKLGAVGVPVVVVAIACGLFFVTWLNRALRLPEKLGVLIAAGTGICGVTAIVSTAPAIKADDEEVAYAVANITLFGLLGMILYPYFIPPLLTTSEQIGLFLGVAVHDTAQVVGAAMAYKEIVGDEKVLQAATVTKLTRNLFLAVVVPGLAYLHWRNRRRDGLHAERDPLDLRQLLPFFVLGFVLMAAVRSIGDATLQRGGLAFWLWDAARWKAITHAVGEAWGARYLLGTAMAAVGLGTRFSVFRGVGLKPFAVGLAGALLVGLAGLAMALLFGQFVKL
jgi:uncharacterized integral membrane protein (TIGR00698 family)